MGIASLPDSVIHDRFYLIPLSASCKESLQIMVEQHRQYLEKHPERLADLSYTLIARREHLQHRTFAIVDSQAVSFEAAPFVASPSTQSPIAMVFTGQGAQYAGMGAALYRSHPGFRQSIKLMEHALARCSSPPSWSLSEVLLEPEEHSRIYDAEFSQPCCTAIQVAIVRLLTSWGVRPSSVVGHSSGEIAAAFAAGSLDEEQSILIAYYRGLVTKTIAPNEGGMAAIGLGRGEVEPLLKAYPGVIIGCENSPMSVTLSGDTDQLLLVMEELRQAFPTALVRRLRVDKAYHSHHMRSVGLQYQAAVSSIITHPQKATLPFYSSVTGARFDKHLDADYWTSNLLNPVRFSDATSALLQDQATSSPILLEVGPHSALAGPVKQIIKAYSNPGKVQYINTLLRNQDSSYAMLFCAGMLLQGKAVFESRRLAPRGQVLIDLPPYPFHRTGPYWSENRVSRAWRLRSTPKHDILGIRVAESQIPTWRNLLRLVDVPWLRDHVVDDEIVFPGAGYVAMAGAAMKQLSGIADYTIRNVTFHAAMILHEETTAEIITHLQPVQLTTSQASSWYNFQVVSLETAGESWTKHVAGQVCSSAVDRSEVDVTIRPGLREIAWSNWSSVLSRVGLNYGPRFKGLRDVSASPADYSAVATIDYDALPDESEYALHPATIDRAMQLSSVAASQGRSRNFTRRGLPASIEEICVRESKDLAVTFEVKARFSKRGATCDTIHGVGHNGEGVFRLARLQTVGIADAESENTRDPHAATETVWMPHLDALSPDQSRKLFHMDLNKISLLKKAELMVVACVIQGHERLGSIVAAVPRMEIFRDWACNLYTATSDGTYPGISEDVQKILHMTDTERLALIERFQTDLDSWGFSPPGLTIHRVYDHLKPLLCGDVGEFELLDNELQADLHEDCRVSDVSDLLKLTGHQRPHQRILDIGAGTPTTEILETLRAHAESPYHDRSYYSYTFADVSSDALAHAKNKLESFQAVDLKVLDISQDPIAQGFEAYKYDLIITRNVSGFLYQIGFHNIGCLVLTTFTDVAQYFRYACRLAKRTETPCFQRLVTYGRTADVLQVD